MTSNDLQVGYPRVSQVETIATPALQGADHLFVCVSGTSEAGKSHMTQRLRNMGAANSIKYLRAAREQAEEYTGNDDPFAFLRGELGLPQEDCIALTWQRIADVTDGARRVSVVETIKHPPFYEGLGDTCLSASAMLIFVDAKTDERVQREVDRTGLDVSKVRQLVQIKDAHKEDLGLDELRAMADVIVCNQGLVTDYNRWIDRVGKLFLELHPLTEDRPAIDYS